MNLRKAIKDWMLPISMSAGVLAYLSYHWLPALHPAGPALESIVSVIQPMIIFIMLFLTFCRIEPHDLRPHRWHGWMLAVQGGLFTLLGLVIVLLRHLVPDCGESTVLIESAMACLICPTATAAAVVTKKLGGDVAGITTYTILINILTAILVPAIVPIVQPTQGVNFISASMMILAKVFPLLIMPCFCAWLLRYLAPRLHSQFARKADLAFYIWAVGLFLAIVVTVKAIVHSTMPVMLIVSIGAVSLVSCIFQFWAGHVLGTRYDNAKGHKGPETRDSRVTTCGQALGQKNTVFAIWMGYTFLSPETSIAGGLYSIWHNLYNSWQIYRYQKR